MAKGIKLIPLSGISTDISNSFMKPDLARFVKNLYYVLTDNAEAITTQGTQLGVLKPLQANEVYCPITLPKGDNYSIGTLSVRETKELYVWVHNSEGDHTIFRINGNKKSCTIVKTDRCFDFRLSPEYFIHESGAWLEIITLIDPVTGATLKKKDLFWTNGVGYMGYLRVDDCIDTNGFDETLYPYFKGNYDKCDILRMGLPTPKSCVEVTEVTVPEQYETIHSAIIGVTGVASNYFLIQPAFGFVPQYLDHLTIPAGNVLSGTYTVVSTVITGSGVYFVRVEEPVAITANPIQVLLTLSRRINNDGVNNNLLFNTWQFRIIDTDVWGRVSIYGIISDMYVPGINDCISVSSNLPSCLDLNFDAGNPFINTKQIAWRNCNDETWHTETTLFLWKGSNIGQWWLRGRNPDINYDAVTNKITYRFCRDKECDPISPLETNLLQPSLPKSCQSIFPLNKTIATANNKDGFNPLSQDVLDKITLTVIPPGVTDPNARNITVYVAIGTANTDNLPFQQVYKSGGKYYYGGRSADGTLSVSRADQKKQFFINEKQSNFCGILVNGQSVIGTQVYVNAAGQLVDDPSLNGYDLSPTHRTFIKFEFTNVPKNSYIFRITSQTVDPARDDSYRNTSTPIWGLCPFNAQNNYNLNLQDRGNASELYIDCCNADYDTLTDNKMLVIADLSVYSGGAQSGYFYQSETDHTRWELLNILNIGFERASSLRTDANGFYWVAFTGVPLSVTASAYSKCNRITNSQPTDGSSPIIVLKDYFMETFFVNNAGVNLFQDAVCNVMQIRGRLVLQGTSIGVSKVVVALTRGGSAVTDDDGFFTVLAHDDASNSNPFGRRTDKLLITSGACTYLSTLPGGCLPVFNIIFNNCTSCNIRTMSVGTTFLIYTQEHGLLSGGTYLPFINLYDWLGRKTFSQPLKPLQIPSIIQSQAIGASTVIVNIDPTAVFPIEFKYFTISLSEETTIEKYLSWIADRIEFIDNSNQINNVTPTQIRIYYQSVTEYALINENNVTTAWDIIPLNENTPVTNDKVQFFLNGNGKFFTKSILARVKYNQTGVYFNIDYTSELADLTQNALVRLIRPKTCTGTEPNFEICSSITFLDNIGKPLRNQFILNAWDTYYLSRQIPVPAPVTPTPQVIQVATTDATDPNITVYTQPVPESTVIENRNFGFRFEHDSPSNFWGKGCHNIGRLNSKNPYEAELVHENQIAFGGGVSVNGQLNYLQYFLSENKHEFNVNNTGGIIYVCPKQGILLIITQYNNWTVGFGDTLARVDANGNVVAPSGSDTFGNPNIQINGNYGCQVFEKNTIRERDGKVLFLDTSRVAVLQHDFRDCQDVSSNKTNIERRSTILSWLAKKINYVREYNNNVTNVNKKFFMSVINPANNEWILSDFTIKGTEYINDERDYAVDKQESMAFDIKAQVWKGMYSSTPEYWGYLESELQGNQLFAFKNGIPYSYYSAIQTKHNTFFGVKCNRVYTFVITEEMMKKFKPLWMEVYCKQSGYFADKIITETGQESRILISYWKQGEFMYSASFMRDLLTLSDPNSPQANANPLIDGNVLYGTWVQVRMIGYPDKDDVYSALEGIQAFFIGESNTGLR